MEAAVRVTDNEYNVERSEWKGRVLMMDPEKEHQ
jgi:hypothetical protein